MRHRLVGLFAGAAVLCGAVVASAQTEHTLWNDSVYVEDNFWVYTMSEDGGPAVTVRREITGEISFSGTDVLVLEQTQSGSLDDDIWYIQRDGGELDLYFYREEMGSDWVTFLYYDGLQPGVALYPKKLRSDVSNEKLADGRFVGSDSSGSNENGSYDSTITFLGTENTTVGSGSYDTVRFSTRVIEDYGAGDFEIANTTWWFNPDVGPVRFIEELTEFQNGSQTASSTRVYTLTSTNIGPQPTATATPTTTATPDPTRSPVPTATFPTNTPTATASPTATQVPPSSDPAYVLANLGPEQWENTENSTEYSRFDDPTFGDSQGLEMYVGDPTNCFGFWQTRRLLDPLPAGEYLIRFHVQGIRGGTANRLPEIRYRVFRADSSKSNMGVMAEINMGQGYPEAFDVYWVSDGSTKWRVSADLLSFRSDLRGGVIVEKIEVVPLR